MRAHRDWKLQRLLSAAAVVATVAIVVVPTASGFPAPPPGAIVYSRELGPDALALGVVPEKGRVLAQVSVLGSQGQGVRGMRVAVGVGGGAPRPALACGAGCYRATLAVRARPTNVVVVLDGTRWSVSMPASWPPADGAALMARVGRAWHSLRSLSYVDRLASGPGQSVLSTWQIQAPDRLSYQVWGGGDSVIIGDKRWSRAAGGRSWVETRQLPVKQPVPFWVSVADAHVLGTATVDGEPTLNVSFFDPGTPGWFAITIDQATMLPLSMHMIATDHFMYDSYGQFNSTPTIVPPQR